MRSAHVCPKLLLELLCPRTGGQPSGLERRYHFLNFFFTDGRDVIGNLQIAFHYMPPDNKLDRAVKNSSLTSLHNERVSR